MLWQVIKPLVWFASGPGSNSTTFKYVYLYHLCMYVYTFHKKRNGGCGFDSHSEEFIIFIALIVLLTIFFI